MSSADADCSLPPTALVAAVCFRPRWSTHAERPASSCPPPRACGTGAWEDSSADERRRQRGSSDATRSRVSAAQRALSPARSGALPTECTRVCAASPRPCCPARTALLSAPDLSHQRSPTIAARPTRQNRKNAHSSSSVARLESSHQPAPAAAFAAVSSLQFHVSAGSASGPDRFGRPRERLRTTRRETTANVATGGWRAAADP